MSEPTKIIVGAILACVAFVAVFVWNLKKGDSGPWFSVTVRATNPIGFWINQAVLVALCVLVIAEAVKMLRA
jgi:xanthine/uracil permease